MQFLSEIGMAICDETMAPGYARWRAVHPQLLDALVAYSGVQADSCVLELGCGTGNYIRAISERTGCDGWGVDPSAAMLAQARVGGSRRLHWVNTEADRTGLGDAQFDLTFCWMSSTTSITASEFSRKPIACLSQAVRCAWQPIPKTSSGPVSLSRFTGPKRWKPNWLAIPVSKRCEPNSAKQALFS